MAAKIGKYEIPFDKEGNQLDYGGWNIDQWKPNHVFEDTLTYVCYGRGRSSVTFEFTRQDGRTVSVFVSRLDEMLPKMRDGKITGRFTFEKRGTNYGCYLLPEGE